jgi:hypothetical protein
MIYNPKTYYNNGRQLQWGCRLTNEQMQALRNGEIFTHHDPDDNDRCVLIDSYDVIREGCMRKDI